MRSAMYGFLRSVLHHMMGHVALTSILKKITTDHQNDDFREFRPTIQSMLDTYSYEQDIMKTANRLLGSDLYRSYSSKHVRQGRAFSPRHDECGGCHRSLVGSALGVVSNSGAPIGAVSIFDCGHSYHESCLGRSQTACPLCSQQQNNKQVKRRAIRSVSVSVSQPKVEEKKIVKSESKVQADDGKTREYMKRLDSIHTAVIESQGRSQKLLSGQVPSVSLHLAPLQSTSWVIGRRKPGQLPLPSKSSDMDDFSP